MIDQIFKSFNQAVRASKVSIPFVPFTDASEKIDYVSLYERMQKIPTPPPAPTKITICIEAWMNLVKDPDSQWAINYDYENGNHTIFGLAVEETYPKDAPENGFLIT